MERQTEKIKDYSAQPDPEVWERIEKTLHRHALRRKWTRIGAGALTVAAIAVALFLINPASTPDSVVSDTPQTVQLTAEAEIPTVSTPTVTEPQPQTAATVAPAVQQQKAVIAENRMPQTSTSSAQTIVPNKAEAPVVSVPATPEKLQTITTEPKTEPVANEISTPSTPLSQDQTAMATEPQQPTVKASTSSQNDTILWIPNAFAPSSDDESLTIFRPRLNHPGETLTDYRMAIFNRSGMQVFSTNNIDQGWNGTYKGRPLSQGAYVYVIYYTDKDRMRHQRKGTVTLIR